MDRPSVIEEGSQPLEVTKRSRNRYLQGLLSVKGLVAAGLLFAVVALGAFAPLIAPTPPNAQSADALLLPSWSHPLGTDEVGRDLLSRLLYGIRVSLLVSVVAVPLSAAVGTLLGLDRKSVV